MSDLFTTVGGMFRSAAPWLSLGMNLLSTVKSFGAASDIEEQGRRNRRMYEDEAASAWRSYEDHANILAHQQRSFIETQRTNFLKSGVALDGTPMEVLNDIIYQTQMDQRALFHSGQAEMQKILNQASEAEWQDYQQASSIRSQAIGQLGSTLITSQLNYPLGKQNVDTALASNVSGEPTTRHYSWAEANAVPGGSGWRPGK